jgi:hypothetical protein
MYKTHSRNFKTPKIKNMRRHREDLNKHQHETKDTIKRELHELKGKTQIIKEELNKDLESIRKKNQTEILEIKSQARHSERPLQQTRISRR